MIDLCKTSPFTIPTFPDKTYIINDPADVWTAGTFTMNDALINWCVFTYSSTYKEVSASSTTATPATPSTNFLSYNPASN